MQPFSLGSVQLAPPWCSSLTLCVVWKRCNLFSRYWDIFSYCSLYFLYMATTQSVFLHSDTFGSTEYLQRRPLYLLVFHLAYNNSQFRTWTHSKPKKGDVAVKYK